jgi:hypothetical protein
MNPTLRYLRLTCRHKWYVLQAGRRTGANWFDLLIHDWSKFTPAEAPHYGRQFFGAMDDPDGFAAAWLHHQNHNPHHWEYWIPRAGRDATMGVDPLPMPERYVREMVADWMAASRAYDGRWPTADNWPWLAANWDKMRLHPITRDRLAGVMNETLGFTWYLLTLPALTPACA